MYIALDYLSCLFRLCFYFYQGQLRYWGIRRSSASPRPHCDGTPAASVWPSPRQSPGPPCPHPSDRTPHEATQKIFLSRLFNLSELFVPSIYTHDLIRSMKTHSFFGSCLMLDCIAVMDYIFFIIFPVRIRVLRMASRAT